jgi:hypothetical protein
MSRLGEGVPDLGVFGQAGRDQIAGDAVGKVVGQAAQLGAGNRVQLVGADRVGDSRAGLRRPVKPRAAATWLTP